MTHGLTRAARGLAARASLLVAGLSALVSVGANGQPAPDNGPRAVDPKWHALVHATLVPRPGETIENATIVIRDGVIESITPGGAAPEGARRWDCAGLTVYAGLIDAHVPVDAPAPDVGAPGAHWNDRVLPQRSALAGEGLKKGDREALRKLGFTAAAISPKGGVFRGTGAVVTLGDAPGESESGEQAILAQAFHAVALESGNWGDTRYPNSQMGAIALIRQTLSDADWRAADLAHFSRTPGRTRPMPADALDALGRRAQNDLPLLFTTGDELEAIRVAKIAREFERPVIIVGSGTEFRRLAAISGEKLPMIIPINFPEEPKVQSEGDAEAVSLAELMTWEQAPTNPRRLDEAGVTIALTTDGLKKKPDFAKNLRSAIDQGLSPDRALAMLTTNPATILGVEDRLGQVAPGFAANLVVVKGDLFDKKGVIRDVWVDGVRHEISAGPSVEPAGEWAMVVNLVDGEAHEGTLTVEGKDGKAEKATIVMGGETKLTARSITLFENRLGFLVDVDTAEPKGAWTLTGVIDNGEMLGTGLNAAGERFTWTATRAGETSAGADAVADAGGDDAKDEGEDDKDDSKDEDKAVAKAPETLPGLPFGAYAFESVPEQEDVLITNATIWTSGPDGVIEGGSMLVRGGKIAAIGKSVNAPSGVRTIDAGGRHVTPGLIDCHSHTGISRGVNEGTQAITSEVRIFDVIDPDSVNWYRELAGGLTMVNQLHGSANPIGGQNSVVKIRWGCESPDDMRMDGAPSGIKFALGENVKQANWGDRYTNRYPQTRMGVETLIRDSFHAAQTYAAQMGDWRRMSTSQRERETPVRRDLELEALAEILAGERLIHCHSYRQDEILMLCRVARDFGFQIGTFQHVLEGYKVADAIREVARGGSCFSDWWAYKVEVIDAIPEDGAIMHEAGVTVSFNSDSDELARRMHAEAGKAVKYGGVSPEEALKFVTINPAFQLGVQDRVGSLEAGKDADFVIWTGYPLSALSRPEATWIDGREYFSIEKDRALRERNNAERQRIIQKILAQGAKKKKDAKDGAAPGGPAAGAEMVDTQPTRSPEQQRLWDAYVERNLDLLRSGADPDSHRCGECGVLDLAHHH